MRGRLSLRPCSRRCAAGPHRLAPAAAPKPSAPSRRAPPTSSRRCPARRTFRACAGSRSAARTPRPTGRSTGASSSSSRSVDGAACDRIFRMALDEPVARARPRLERQGRDDVLVLPSRATSRSSTRRPNARARECPPPPDRSKGYVWPLHELRHLQGEPRRQRRRAAHRRPRATTPRRPFARRTARSSSRRRRDGDLELYRMDVDGKNVEAPDERPRLRRRRVLQPRLLEDRLARLAPAARQGARRLQEPARQGPGASDQARDLRRQRRRLRRRAGHVPRRRVVRPVVHPRPASASSSRATTAIPKGREFDIWAIDINGTNLERITRSPGFDGFPMFSPDGKRSRSRRTA